jgi:hypothetical protein
MNLQDRLADELRNLVADDAHVNAGLIIEHLGLRETIRVPDEYAASIARLQFANSELTKLEDWIADNLPRVVPKPDVTTVDLVIYLLDTCKMAYPMVAKVLFEQIWTPLVDQFRAMGFEVPEVEVKKS